MAEYLLQHQPCYKCGSSDAKSYYVDGSSTCFACGRSLKHDSPDGNAQAPSGRKRQTTDRVSVKEVKSWKSAGWPERGLPESVMELFGVKAERNTETREVEAYYFPYYIDGEVVGYKGRKKDSKEFFVVGAVGKDVEPFGWQRVNSRGKLLIITEGELDVLAATTMLKDRGKDYKVITVPNGAHTVVPFLKKNLMLFEHFEKIVLNLDMDEHGIAAAKEAAALFQPHQGYIMSLPDDFKDANDLLLGGKSHQYTTALSGAREYKPDGIVLASETWDRYKNRPEVQSYPFPDSWVDVNAMTYGIRLGELDTLTSGTSAGKTQLMREIVYHMVTHHGLKMGILSLEEPIEDTIESYIGLACNKRLHLPDVTVSEQEEYEGWKKVFGDDKVVLYDAFGGEEDSVMMQIRYMAKGEGCQGVVLDHLHMLLDGKDSEKEQIERMMLKLKKLTQELKIWIGLIAHLKKSDGGNTFEEGGIADLDDLKGSSSIKQLSNGVYVLARDQQADDTLTRNTSDLYVKKCRYTGRTGKADSLLFDDETGRMVKLGADDVPW